MHYRQKLEFASFGHFFGVPTDIAEYWLKFFVALSVDYGGLIAVGDHWRSVYVPWQFVYQWSLVAFEPMLSECAQLFISSRGCEVEDI